MSKIVTSVSLDEDVHKRVKDDKSVNVSGLVNSVLREYYRTGDVDGLQMHLDRVERELEGARAKVERLEDERDRLLRAREEKREQREDALEEVLDTLSSIDDEMLTKDNPAVVNKAADVSMRPEELAELARES